MRNLSLIIITLTLLLIQPLQAEKGITIRLRDFGSEDVGYLVIPRQQPQAGILLAPDAHGLTDEVKQVCERIAKMGYIILAIDLYNGKTASTPQEVAQLKENLQNKSQKAALETGFRFFKESPRFHMEKTLLIGAGETADIVLEAAQRAKTLAGITLLHPTPDNLSLKQLKETKLPTLILADGPTASGLPFKKEDEDIPDCVTFATTETGSAEMWNVGTSDYWNTAWKKIFSFWTESLKKDPKSFFEKLIPQ